MALHRKILILVAAVLAAVVSISACSSSSTTSGSSPAAGATSAAATASAAAAAAAGTPITIGVECSCSGAFGTTVAVGYTLLQAWQKSVNAAGGLNGHPVQLIEKNNDSNPATALTDAQALVADKVTVIFDLDILDSLWEKTVSASKIPVIGGNFSSPGYYTDPDWYPSGQTNDSITYSVAAVAKQAGATNLADFYCAESAQCQQSVPLIKAAGQSVGVPVVYSASIAATAPNYTAQCVAAKQAGVKAIFIGDSITVIDRVASDCNQQGYDPIYVTEGTGFQNMALTTPGLENNLWSSYPILPYFSTKSSVTAMNAILDKYYPGATADTLTWSEFAAQAWTGALLIAQAVKNAGVTSSTAVSSATITDGLNKVSDETLGGFSPPLTFTGAKHSVDCWYTGRVQSGKAVQVGGLSCEKG
ncbi:MAG TPA: ABC transporter substrate-binding protein [Trebonia sp.]|nr:ABC transporter substrate-binding protein [Trebonia sp.]